MYTGKYSINGINVYKEKQHIVFIIDDKPYILCFFPQLDTKEVKK